MKTNVTLSADEAVIRAARRRAAMDGTTLNRLFRDWLEQYVAQDAAGERYDELMGRLGHIRSGGPFTRDEMNERG